MGWLRVVGSLKLYVFFAEHSLFYMALLQRRPIILRSLLIVATPHSHPHTHVCTDAGVSSRGVANVPSVTHIQFSQRDDLIWSKYTHISKDDHVSSWAVANVPSAMNIYVQTCTYVNVTRMKRICKHTHVSEDADFSSGAVANVPSIMKYIYTDMYVCMYKHVRM